MFEIPLRNRAGQTVAYAVVDDEDVVLLADRRWSLHRSDTKSYAINGAGAYKGQPKRVFMHRVIVGLQRGDVRCVDHVNGDTLDNRRENLRIVSPAENAQNQGARGGSRFRGVSFDKSRGRWLASATLDGKRTTIGRFDTEEEAGVAAAAWRFEHMPYSREAA